MELNHFLATYLYVFIGILSLLVGSLLNVVIYRLPLMLRAEFLRDYQELTNQESREEKPSINLFLPRSFCPACQNTVKARHNIPLVSYLWLRGKCAYCGHPISKRYPLVELVTLLLSLAAMWHFGLTLHLPFVLLFIWLLIPMFFIDLDHQLLPDSLTLGLLWLGLLANTANLFTPLPIAVLSAAGAYLVLWLFIQLFYLVTGKVGMGNGDFKLFAAFGAWLGWTQLPLILLLASISGAVIGSIYLRLQQKGSETPIAFGPFLCIAGLISLFYGNDIIHWYLKLWF
ncbi:prepilin peptidase [Legionella taurinensis]|uniref:Prepilin leader peptidase/N-methyltransferase n=1 Tax=Legionella taurinensis TaxID=70611 RepID=A0A3A5L654_9GAMM|nr:A24 family peptidase [Legionella taurinensis]MDX1836865.1 A24 family peptidase [Legionella taurinensis]PUT41280.1 prepilin peptidase [Legionella taurinensis]PUT42405.1 prepilin peptidase [Legionella taurinensis]PUT43931.1 prepilin peptidase [Legionella taurinensis]PUT47186.1 prepilin peptidase [Legionella taurinensis]